MRKLAVTLVAVMLVAGGCGSKKGQQGHADINIVASTSVWGAVAAAVAGTRGKVKSVITSSVDNPHLFKPSLDDQVAIADAQLVVYNGGGYDPFVDRALAAHPAVKRVNAFTTGGHQPGSNPHVFYDVPTVVTVIDAIRDQLIAIDPADATEYRNNAGIATGQVDNIGWIEGQIAQQFPGAPVIATDDAPYYMIVAAKLSDRTPAGYYTAVDAGTQPAPQDIAAMVDLITSHRVRVVLFNPQTPSTPAQRIVDAAKAAKMPVVNTSETLPENVGFVVWQTTVANTLGNSLQASK